MPTIRVVVERCDGEAGPPVEHAAVQQTNKEPMSEGRMRLGKKIGVKKSMWKSYDVLIGGPEGVPLDWDKKTGEQAIDAGTVIYLRFNGVKPSKPKKKANDGEDSASSAMEGDGEVALSQPPLLEGILTKRGHVRKNWKKRWFSLHREALTYRDKKSDTKLKGLIALHAGTVLSPEPDLKKPKPHLFSLIATNKTEYFLAAATAESRSQWLAVLASVLGSQRAAASEADADAAPAAAGSAAAAGSSGATAAEATERSDDGGESDEDDPYAIGAVLDMRLVKRQIQYLISFKHLGPENNTWEFAANLEGIDDLIEAFHQKQDSEYAAKRETARTMTLADWELLGVLGEGGYGKVELCRLRANPNPDALFAIKILNKAFLLDKGEVEHTRTEAQVLQSMHHPFLVGMHYAFQSASELFFVMDYVDGGDLVKAWKAAGSMFPEPRAKFYAAEVLLALEHLHSHGIIHRDLKMENLLLDAGGHVLLTDFGLAKSNMDDGSTTRTLCGTFACLAPEVVENEAYGKPVDWWGYAVTLFQMATGALPFPAEDRMVLFEQILACDVTYPSFLSEEIVVLFRALFRRAPAERLGPEGIRASAFFAATDFDALLAKRVPPPYVPPVSTMSRAERAKERVAVSAPAVPQLSEVEQRLFRGFSFAPNDLGLLAAAKGFSFDD